VECRPGTAAVATLVIGVTIALALRGIERTEAEGSAAGSGGPLLGPRVRAWYRGLFGPAEQWLADAGVRPDHLTYAQLVASVAAGVAFAGGAIFLAGWLTILAGTLDILDGGLARRTGAASSRGAFLDSVTDRWAEVATFAGLAVFYYRNVWMLAVVALAAFASQMVSYVRARAEGVGIPLTGGRAQRPERYVILGFGAWISGLVAHLLCPWLGRQRHLVLGAAVCLLAGLAIWTALQRTREALAALDGGSGA
jgi:phosphatidylglycerophosphate synthase